ncbi:MAG TPA: transporter [Edaphobacter sp.]
MKTLSVVLAASFLLATHTLVAQETEPITTDRPSTGTGPELVPTHSLETENGVGWTNDDHRSRFDLPESFVRYGINNRIEARILMPNSHVSGGDPTQSDDIQFGVKLRLRPEESAWPMAFATGLSAPSGTGGLSSGAWDPYEAFSVSHHLPKNFYSFSSITFASISGAPHGRSLFTQGAVDFGRVVTPHHAVYVEYAPLYDGRQHTSGYIIDGGTIWTVRPNLQLDLRLGHTVVGESSGFNVAIGYSFRRFVIPPIPNAAR